jgi:hypothetical protein
MSDLSMTDGIDIFKYSLRLVTADISNKYGIELSMDIPPAMAFSLLIKQCARKYGCKVAVLIDEYDAPVTDLIDEPDKAEEVRKVLREFYRKLKVCDEYISFVFVTGITKFVQGGLYSAFNNPTDISLNSKYGAMTGFTQNELEFYFESQLNEVASNLQISQKALLEKMHNYYNGFCFDGQTLVYDPFSTALFFDSKKFLNFWFNSGTPDQLISFFKDKHLTVEEFRGVEIELDRIVNPSQNRFQDPQVYLYQLGYLSLRPSQSENYLVLDYPNTEVRESMALRLLESYFTSPKNAEDLCNNLKIALSDRDPVNLVTELNRLLSQLPYDYFKTKSRDEYFYCNAIFTAFYAIGLDPHAEKHGNWGRADFIVKSIDQIWVIEIKVSHNNEDKKLADEALTQIKETNYAGGYLNPVILGLVVNDKARAIKFWKCEGGLASKPEVLKKNK